MKNLVLSAILAVVFCGCSFDFLDFGGGTANLENANGVKCEILGYERHSKTDYTYKFKVLQNNKIYTAKSPRYYYNGGDTAFVVIQNGVILNMILDSRNQNLKNSSARGGNDGEITKKILRQNDEISVPKSENISF